MAPQDSRTESLHQQASEAYLQGEFQQALVAWREIVRTNPDDERAKEGVRLCELLADDVGDAVAGDDSSAAGSMPSLAPDAPFAGASEGFDEDLEELDEVLEKGAAQEVPSSGASVSEQADESFSFDFSNLPEQPAAADSAVPDADRLAEGIDFGEPHASDAAPPGDSTPAPAVFESAPHEVDLPAAPPSGPPESRGPVEDDALEAAAAELRSRVNELLAEALTHYEQGRKEESLVVLDRIFILDETNDAALALSDNIRAELKADQPEVEEPIEGLSAADILQTETPPAAEAPSPPVTADSEFVDPLDPGGLPGEALSGDAAAAEPEPAERPSDVPDLAGASETRRTRDGKGKKNLVLVAAIVAMLATGGGLAYVFLGGSGSDGDEAAADGSLSTAGGSIPGGRSSEQRPDHRASEGNSSGSSGARQPGGAGQDAGSGTHAKNDRRAVEAMLADAQQAIDDRDFAMAVLTYKKAIELDPENSDALYGLERAGELYRKAKETETRRREAIEAFNAGSYRSALTIFYRLPEDEDAERLSRYKRNGWYNMGVQSLQAGDCSSAVDHLKEARGVDPEDGEVLLTLELARECRYSRSDRAYLDEVRGIPFRGLED